MSHIYIIDNDNPTQNNLNWEAKFPLKDTSTWCRDLGSDVAAARRLAAEQPGRVVLLRYEDLIRDGARTMEDLSRFLGLPLTPGMRRMFATEPSSMVGHILVGGVGEDGWRRGIQI